jgi:hypothetical protein
MSSPQIPRALSHFLICGCWSGEGSRDERFAVHQLAGFVSRNDLAGLRRAWQDLGPMVKAEHPDETFAEAMLAGRLHVIDTESWPPQFGATRCPAHAKGR